MAGTKAGGLKAAKTNKEKHGKDFYAKIGSKGGKLGHTGGFATDIECRCADIAGKHFIKNCAGMRGGTISRKQPKVA